MNQALTAKTITDAQIRDLYKWARGCLFTEAGSIAQLCACSAGVVSPEVPGWRPKTEARARCAEIINTRAKEPK